MGDETKLTRIAINMLSNAKKFTPAGGTVTFGVRQGDAAEEKTSYSIYVRDIGIGMSKEFIGRALDQFEREHTTTEVGETGNGLGLSIVKKISELMGGECTIKSELGQGTEIMVSVPLKQTEETVSENVSSITYDFTGKRILVVEDNDFNHEISAYMLQEAGFEIDEAEDGLACVEKVLLAKAGYYDVILMDIQMPVMDGFLATKEIRSMDEPEK